MGAYLSEPVTEKNSTDEENDRLRYGVSSMQGWRISQEDAHNCVIDFDKNTSLFAVYDGHGGHEVAAYCAQKLPEYIKQTTAYKAGDFEKALIDAFLGFDATIATRDVVAVLKEIAGVKDHDDGDDGADGSDYDEENVNHLYEEASMPIEQVMEKYQFNLLNPHLKKMQSSGGSGDKLPISPLLKARKSCVGGETSGCSSSSSSSGGGGVVKSLTGTGESSKSINGEEASISEKDESKPKIEEESKQNEDTLKKNEDTSKQNEKTESKKEIIITNGDTAHVLNENGEEGGDGTSSCSKKGKGKAIKKPATKPETTTTVMNLRKRFVGKLYTKLLETQPEESDSDDDNDVTFEETPAAATSASSFNSSSSSEDEDDDASSDDSDKSSEGADDENEETPDDEDSSEGGAYDEEEEPNEFTRNMTEEPGSDSGCTAVLALLRENTVFVANAGDSRCIICRKGEALDMSFDHKPEDDPEMERIINAGGEVTPDGRVNGGLNLSRAIGDHAYKQNKTLGDREQMITALPDIKTCTINPAEDEFMVLACDGIWNFMSSQEVVDFVKPRLSEETGPEKLSQICEELFDHCLAPNTMGDGTGCDNMTAIIVQFKNSLLKRNPNVDDDDSANTNTVDDCAGPAVKRIKTDDCGDGDEVVTTK